MLKFNQVLLLLYFLYIKNMSFFISLTINILFLSNEIRFKAVKLLKINKNKI